MVLVGPLNTSIESIYFSAAEAINAFLDRNGYVFQLVSFVVAAIALYYVFRGVYSHKARSIDSKIFIIYCIAVLINAVGAGVYALYGEKTPEIIPLIAYTAFLFLPAIMCLHIWSQVDYKPITKSIVSLYFAIPAIFFFVNIYNVIQGTFDNNIWNSLCIQSVSLQNFFFFVYWLAMIIKSLSLCFNVFYQMPRHMRGSTLMLISARIVVVVAIVIATLINAEAAYLLALIAFAIAMNRMMAGFFRASASNVITTSRQFVFSNLSTMIIVVSLKGRILEWNKPVGPVLFSFVKPKYLQPFDEYRKELLEKCNGVVSPHDENVITLTLEDREVNLMISTKSIKEGDRQFGTLVELSEITSIYSILRAMESIAELDHMTGLYNRNAYMEKADNLMTEENMPLLIIIGDVNNLKLINDTYSHLSGDRLLCAVAEIMKAQAPKEAFIARIGGDEIVLLISGGKVETAQAFSEKVYFETQKINDEEFGHPSISFGWSIINSANEEYNVAFEKADEMMYENKKAYKAGKPIVLSGSLHKKATCEKDAVEKESPKIEL